MTHTVCLYSLSTYRVVAMHKNEQKNVFGRHIILFPGISRFLAYFPWWEKPVFPGEPCGKYTQHKS